MCRSLAVLLLTSLASGARPPDRYVTFRVYPPEAKVLIQSGLNTVPYRANRRELVSFPSNAFDLQFEAEGWEADPVPVNVNQFSDQWPPGGATFSMRPVSLVARLSLLPRWPLLFLLLIPVWRRRARQQAVPPAVVHPAVSLPWELSAGDRLGPYEVLERLGEGVSAVVYRVRGSSEEAALKLLKPQALRDGDGAARFRREMKTLCRLRHPNIPYLEDFGEHRGMLYLVMELLPQGNLLQALHAGDWTRQRALQVLVQLGLALEFCHRHGVLHRDIKPENVVFGRDGQVRLTDFGLARPHDATTLTVEGSLLGTPAYMAPELVQGAQASEASDQYSLGCLAYQLLSGRTVFAGDTPLAILMQHVQAQPDPLFDPLWPWVERTLRKSPEERFPTTGEAVQALKELMG